MCRYVVRSACALSIFLVLWAPQQLYGVRMSSETGELRTTAVRLEALGPSRPLGFRDRAAVPNRGFVPGGNAQDGNAHLVAYHTYSILEPFWWSKCYGCNQPRRGKGSPALQPLGRGESLRQEGQGDKQEDWDTLSEWRSCCAERVC